MRKKDSLLAGYTIDGVASQNTEKNNYFLSANQSNYELIEYTTCDEKIIYVNGNVIFKGPKPFLYEIFMKSITQWSLVLEMLMV